MHFGIYVPGFDGEPIEALQQAGCGELYAEGDLAPSGMRVDRGPDGGPGLIVQWVDNSQPPASQPKCDYDSEWTWLPAPMVPTSLYWLGINWADPPRPEELLRWRPEHFGQKIDPRHRTPRFDGSSIRLGDDQAWTVPNQWSLPMALVLDPATGEYKRHPKRRHQTLWQEMQTAFEQIVRALQMQADQQDVVGAWGDREMMAFGARMIGMNYRVNEFVLTTLEAIDGENLLSVVAHATHVEQMSKILDDLKKKRAGSSTMSSSSDTGPGVAAGRCWGIRRLFLICG